MCSNHYLFKSVLGFLLLISNAFIVHAHADVSPTRISESITIDGLLNEDVWHQTPSINHFTVVTPDTGATPSYQTDTRIAYSEAGLYFAISSYQPYETQVERLSSRDNDVERDSIRVVLDTSGKGSYGYIFKVGLGGSLIDGTVKPERDFAFEWNTPWQAKTTRHADRWDAEVYIPWSGLKLPSATDRRTIGVSIDRRVSYLAENWAVPALSESRSIFLSALLPVHVDALEAKSELTFVPYFSASVDRLNKVNEKNYGFDLYYQPSSDSKLALTVNPDFAMVENDDIVVNFSAFETFLPEKRAFFLEDQDIFEHKGIGRVINTRRIGARPDAPELAEGQKVKQGAGFSDIVAAGKFTGQAGNVRYGVMSALEDNSTFILNDGSQTSVDGRNFLALRSLYETTHTNNNYSSLGYLGTLTQHHKTNAHTHMLDSRYRTADEHWQLYGQLLHSSVEEGSAEKNSLNNKKGYGQFVQAKYSPKAGLLHTLELSHIDRNLDLNDMGFLKRNDRNRFYYALDLPNVTDSSYYKSWDPRGWLAYEENNNGERLLLRTGIWQDFTFNDLSRWTLTVQYSADAWNDRNSRGNGSYRTNSSWHTLSVWKSDRSKPFSYSLDISLSEAQISGLTSSIKPSIRYSPKDTITIDAELKYKQQDNWLLWRGENRIDAFASKQLNATVKTTWIADDAQEIRLALRWLGLQAEAGNAYRIGSTGDLNLSDEARSKNFTKTDLAVQLRYKYQFAPLSDLYLVYSRGGSAFFASEDDISDGFADLLADSISEKTADQLLFKIRYRF